MSKQRSKRKLSQLHKVVAAVVSAFAVSVLLGIQSQGSQLAADVTSCVSPEIYNSTLAKCVGPDTTETSCGYENVDNQNCQVCRNAWSGNEVSRNDCVAANETRMDTCPDGSQVPVGTNCPDNSGGGDGDYDDAICNDTYQADGSCRSICTSPDGTATWDDGECQNFGGDSCWEEDRGDQKCEVCTDYTGATSETCWGGGDGSTVPADEIARTCKDMNKQLAQIEKDLGRRIEKDIAKRLSRDIKRDQKEIERTEKMIAKGERKGFPQEELDRLREDLEDLQARIAERSQVTQKANDLSAAFRRDLENTRTSIANTCSQATLTWNDMDSGWKKLNKLNYYWTFADVLDVQVNVGQNLGEFNDFRQELSRVRYMYTKAGADAPSALDDLEEGMATIEEEASNLIRFAEETGAQIRELANSGDDWDTNESIRGLGDDLRYASQDFWDLIDDWHFSEPWQILDEARFAAECYEQTGYMKEELIGIRGDLENAEAFADAIAELNVASLAVDVEGAHKVIANGYALIENMEAELVDACNIEDFGPGSGGPDFYRFDRFWPAMEQLGRVAQKYFTRLVDYILDNSDAYDSIVDDVGEETVQEMIDFAREQMHGGGDSRYEGDYGVIWEDVYDIDDADVFGGLEKQLSGEIASMLQRGQFDGAEIEKLINVIVDRAVEQMTAAIMNSFAVLGDQLGNQLMQNNNLIAEQAIEISGLSGADEDLIEKAKTTVYVNSSTAEECASILGELKSATETGDNTGIFTQRLQECVDRADQEAVGSNGVEFKDCRLSDDDWFAQYCVASKQQGVVSGYKDAQGNLTGEVGPANNVTLAEVTKMAAETCGKGMSSGNPADSRANGQWFSGYVKTFENEGIGSLVKVDDWNKAATRKQAFGILAKMCDVEPVDYQGVYPDLSGSDPLAGYMQALYDLGVVTGEGNGNLNPDGLIVRAAVMKIMSLSVDVTEEVQFHTQLVEEDFDAEDFLNSFGGEYQSGDPGSGYEGEDYEDFEGDEDFEDFEEDLFEGFGDEGEEDDFFEEFDDLEFEDDFDEISAVFAPLPL